jgi:hypothetical protein
MSDLVVFPSKKKLLRLALTGLAGVAAGCFMIFSDSSDFIEHLIGYFIIIFCGFAFLYIGKRLIRPSPSLIINMEGILDNASGLGAGFIRWAEIANVEIVEIENQKCLSIFPLKPDEVLERQSIFKRWLMRFNDTGILTTDNGMVPSLINIPLATLSEDLEVILAHLQKYLGDRVLLPLTDRGGPVVSKENRIGSSDMASLFSDYDCPRVNTKQVSLFRSYLLVLAVLAGLIIAYFIWQARPQDDASAQFALGYKYAQGDGVEKDSVKAVKLYRKAAEQGHSTAQFNLAIMYHNGDGVAKDSAEAVRWFLKAAEPGKSTSAAAQVNLGVLYNYGDGVPYDASEAAKWYRKAAEQGEPMAQEKLGVLYHTGEGVSKDLVEAHAWFITASAAGNQEARKSVARTEKEMTRDQLAEAIKLARGRIEKIKKKN